MTLDADQAAVDQIVARARAAQKAYEAGATQERHVWVKLDGIEDAALPAPVKKLLIDLARPSLFA